MKSTLVQSLFVTLIQFQNSDRKPQEASHIQDQQKQQDPFSKAAMHIISKEYYKESQISDNLKYLVEQCVKEWDELQKLHQIISDREDVSKIISQIASVLCSDMQVKSIQKTSPIFFYGDKDDQIYYVLKGQVQLFIPKSQKEIWDEVDLNKRLKNSSNDQKILEEKDKFDIVVNAIQKMKGSHIDLIKQNEKLRKKYFDETYQVSKIKKVHQVKVKQMFGELSYLLEKPRPYTAIASEELYCAIFEPKTFRRALGEYYSFINSKNIYLNNYFNSNIRKETIFHLSVLFSQEIKLHLGDYLFKEGEQGNRIYLLKQGKIEFQRRLASSYILQNKKAQFKKIQKTGKDYDMLNKNSEYFTAQSVAKLTQGDEIDNESEISQAAKRSTKKKKTVQASSQTQPQLSQEDSLVQINSNKKIQDNVTEKFNTQSSIVTSMVGFDDFDKSDFNHSSNGKSSNLNYEEVKYKDVSLGLIQQGEFFGFEDILISSLKNYSQNISQNRRTYSAKIVSSDAIVLCIERSAFLKILSQNQALDQDVKTKALVKIQYHQQRIDSLKRFEDSKHISYHQKLPLKEMLKDRYLSMDLRPNQSKPLQTSINNLQRQKDLKINLENVSNSDKLSSTPQSVSMNQSPQQIQQSQYFKKQEGIDYLQKNTSQLQKNDSFKIKQEKKLIDDIDNFEELNIPKDISKGNVQFLRFHNGQFTDLKSMKQSYLDQEERIKQIKKSKHSVNISDENQLALERLYQKTNSPSIKNFKNIILKKNPSLAKSAFNKCTNNNINSQAEENQQKGEGEQSNSVSKDNKNQDNDENSSSPSHQKLKLILTKNKSLKQIEQQPYSQQLSTQKNQSYSFNQMLNSSQLLKRDESKERDQSHSFIKLQQIESNKEQDKIQSNLNNVRHKQSELIAEMSLSQNEIQQQSNQLSTTVCHLIKKKTVSDETLLTQNDGKTQKLSINILSENAKQQDTSEADSMNIQQMQHSQDDIKLNLFKEDLKPNCNQKESFLSPHSSESESELQEENLKNKVQSQQRYQNNQARNQCLQVNQQKLSDLLTPTNLSRKQEISSESYLGFNIKVQVKERLEDNINQQEDKKQESQLSIRKQPNRFLRRYKDSDYELPKIFLSPSEGQLNYSHELNETSQNEKSQRMQNKYQQSLTDLGQDIPSHRDLQFKLQVDQMNGNDMNPRSKSLNYLEDPSRLGTFSSFLPSLTNFDIGSEQTNSSQIFEKKQMKGELKQKYLKGQNRVRSIEQKKQEIPSQQSIYFNQYLQSYSNAQKIIQDLKQHLNDKTNSQDVSTYITMRNHSLPSLHHQPNKKLTNSDNKNATILSEIDSKFSSPLRTSKIDSKSNSKYTSPSLQQNKTHHYKMRNFELNYDGKSIINNLSPRLEMSHPDIKQLFTSKVSKRSDDYFKNLFSNPKYKQSLI